MRTIYYKPLTLAILTLLVPLFAQAQQPAPEDVQAFRQEVRAYAEARIFPTLQRQRAKLNPSLTDSEKKTLASLRKESATLKAMMQQNHEAFRAARLGELKADTDEGKLFEEFRNRRHAVVQEAMTIALAHKERIDKLLGEDIAQERQNWRSAIGQIAAERLGKDRFRQTLRAHRHLGLDRMLSPVRFLLWDGRTPQLEARAKPAKGQTDHTPPEIQAVEGVVNLYPNPAIDVATVEVALKKEGHVRIAVLDRAGHELTLVKDQTMPPGQHAIDVNLAGLKGAASFVQIVTPAGKEVRKIVSQ